MPMYFFDVVEVDGTVVHNVVSVELADHNEALDAASETVLSVLQDDAPLHSELLVQIIVKDETGNEIGRRDATLIKSDNVARND